MNRFARAAVAAAGTTALGAAAMFAGVATQVPTPPVVLATDDPADDAVEDLIAQIVADMTRAEDPEDWDRRYGDGSGD